MTPKDLEIKLDCELPALYHRLFAEDMFWLGGQGPGWYARHEADFIKRPPLLIFGDEFEFFDLDRVETRTHDLRAPDDYRRADPQFRFIPFAKNGAGDLYCFFLNDAMDGNIPIVLVWHDDDAADYCAKNLHDFIVINLLTAAARPYELQPEADAEFLLQMRAMYASHTPYLSLDTQPILSKVVAGNVRDFPDQDAGSERALISETELDAHVNELCGFARAGQSFRYTLPDIKIIVTAANKRRVGTLRLLISPIPLADTPVAATIKALNWRTIESPGSSTVTLTRKNFVFFGPPSFASIEAGLRQKLMILKTGCASVTIFFEELETQEVFEVD